MSILFRDEIAEAESHKLKCPKCDTVQSAKNERCTNCGHDLSEARKAKFAQEYAATDPVSEDAAQSSMDQFACPVCGNGNDYAESHCKTCGAKLNPPSHMTGGILNERVSNRRLPLLSDDNGMTMGESVLGAAYEEAKHPRGRGGKWVRGMRVQHRDGGAQAVVHGPEENGRVPVKFTDGSRDPDHVFHVKSEDLESLERPGGDRTLSPRKHGLVSQAEEDHFERTGGGRAAGGIDDAEHRARVQRSLTPEQKALVPSFVKKGATEQQAEMVALHGRKTFTVDSDGTVRFKKQGRFYRIAKNGRASFAMTEADLRESAAGVLFSEVEHPRGRGGKWVPKLGQMVFHKPKGEKRQGPFKVVGEWRGGYRLEHTATGTTHVASASELEPAGHGMEVRVSDRLDKPGQEYEKGARVRLPDGREGTIMHKTRGGFSTFGGRHDTGDEPEYAVATTTPTPDAALVRKHASAIEDWRSGRAYLDNAGNYRLKDGGVIAPWNSAVKKDLPTRSPGSRVNNHGARLDDLASPGRYKQEQVKHSDLRYATADVIERRGKIEALQVKAEKAGGKQKPLPKGVERAVTNTAAAVPDEWKVANGYGEFVNPDHRNPAEGTTVRVMPTHPLYAGMTGEVTKSAYTERGSGRTVAEVRLESGHVVQVGNNDIHDAARPPYVRMRSGVNVEHMIYHYLTGHPPREIYPPGSAGYAQWSYPPKGISKKSDREAYLRKIVQALASREDPVAYERLLAEACDMRRVLGPLDDDDAEALVEAAGFAVEWDPVRHPRGRGGKFAEVMHLLRANGRHDLGHGVSIERSMLGVKVRTPSGAKSFLDAERGVEHAVSVHSDQARKAEGPHFLMRYSPGGERGGGSLTDVISRATDEQLRQNHDVWQKAPRSESRTAVLRAVADESARRRAGGTRGVSKAQALVDSGLADNLADARAQLADMGEGGRLSPGGEGGSRHQRKLERMKVGDTERFGAVAVKRGALSFTVSANGVTREAPTAGHAAGLVSAHFQGHGLTLEHPDRILARARLGAAGAVDPERRGAGVSSATHEMYDAMGTHPLTREEALASGRHAPGGERLLIDRRGRSGARVWPGDRMAGLREVVRSHQAHEIEGHLVDVQTANAMLAVYGSLGPENKTKFHRLSLPRVAEFAWKNVR